MVKKETKRVLVDVEREKKTLYDQGSASVGRMSLDLVNYHKQNSEAVKKRKKESKGKGD